MPLPKTIQKPVSTLTKNFDKCMNKLERLYAAGSYDEYLALRKGELNTIYNDVCALLREADVTNASYRADLLDAVQPIIDEVALDKEAADTGCLTLRSQDYHEKPIVIKDQRIRSHAKSRGEVPHKGPKPHPRSSCFSNFGPTLAKWTATSADRSAICVYDARCEIDSVRDYMGASRKRGCDVVSAMRVSAGGSCLAVAGWVSTDESEEKEFPAPWVAYHFPNHPKSKFTEFMSDRFDTGLAGTLDYLTLDEDQQLIFVADEDRVKSFAWATTTGPYYPRPLATHTLDSTGFQGPMTTLPNGTFARAGKGAAAIWDLKQLKTHGPKGNNIIGKTIYIDDECEHSSDIEDMPDFEYSSGSPRTSQVRFTDDPKLEPTEWQVLPYYLSTVLAAGGQTNKCVAIDLEHGGKTITRYQGHSGYVSHVSVSAADPHVFLTSAYEDEYVRVFDVRQPQAVLQFVSGRKGSPIALAHPNGIPTVFASSASDKDFRLWDIRSRACVYELGVDEYCDAKPESLAWDPSHNTLYSLKSIPDDPDEYSDYGDLDEIFDHNRIYRYSFKENPEYSIIRADYHGIESEGFFGADSDLEQASGSDEDYAY